MPLVAPLIARFTLEGTILGTATWANIWDVEILADVEVSRATICTAYAGIMIDAWAEHIAPVTSVDVSLTSVSFVDLNTIDGATGNVTEGFVEECPVPGVEVVNSLSANTSILVTKNIEGTRGRRSGRMYVVGVDENQCTALALNPAEQVTQQGAWTGFFTDVLEPAGIPDASCAPVVVHTRNDGTPTEPDIVFDGESAITTLNVQSALASQRRRLRR